MYRVRISWILLLSIGVCCLSFVSPAVSQPIGEEMTLNDETPTFDLAGLEAITVDGPVLLGQSNGEDRESKICILQNGSTVVFWVNRNGSHHINGVDSSGNLLLPTITDDSGIDIIVGANTGGNTNWTLSKADKTGEKFLVAATWQNAQLSGSQAVVPDTVIDMMGIRQDDGQGHGFFKLFNSQLQPITSKPVSISQFSAGHREWDCCWLSDGKFVISTVARGHQYEGDPDFPDGGDDVGLINIFNADGTRFKDEFFVSEDMTGEQNDLRLGSLANGFVCVYKNLGVGKGIIFDNNGNRVKEFIVTDEATGISYGWMDAGGGNAFVTVSIVTTPEGIGLPAELSGMAIVLAQVWSDQGEPITPFILASQHMDFRGLGRERCAMAPNGSFVISWHDKFANYVDEKECVVARVFNADGTPASDAFVAHPLPEFKDPATGESSGGGDAGEAIPAISNDIVSVAWGSRAVPGKGFGTRDAVVMTFKNPAVSTAIQSWELY